MNIYDYPLRFKKQSDYDSFFLSLLAIGFSIIYNIGRYSYLGLVFKRMLICITD